VSDIDCILVPGGGTLRQLTPEVPAGHHERLMQQRCFGDWYVFFGRCPE
jgi:hypothetical protein